jgi:hypothetical protein
VHKKGLEKLCTALYPGCHVLRIYFGEKFLFSKRFKIVFFSWIPSNVRPLDENITYLCQRILHNLWIEKKCSYSLILVFYCGNLGRSSISLWSRAK